MHTMSTNFAKTLVWKYGNDVKLWRHKQCTPKTNNHHMTLNQPPHENFLRTPLMGIRTPLHQGGSPQLLKLWERYCISLRKNHAVSTPDQWRTQKIFMGVSFSGMWWSFVFGVRFLWRHTLTSFSCFQANFVDVIGIFFYTHSPYFCKYQALHTPLIIKFLKISSSRGGNPNPLTYPLAPDGVYSTPFQCYRVCNN